MRSWCAIARTTALELLSEPLCLLVTLAAVALTALAPALHYHQFGEASRMARDTGFSVLLLGGGIYAAFAAHKTIRREIESGTIEMALTHSISGPFFFCAKFTGCLSAYLMFVLTVAATMLTVVNGAEIGGAIAARTGNVARLWGPSLSLALLPVVLALASAALLHRFSRFRFVLSTQLIALASALLGTPYRLDSALALRLLPVASLFALPPIILLAASAAFAIRFRSNVAASLTALTALLLIPLSSNYCLSDALTNGGVLPPRYFLFALLAFLPAGAAFLALGIDFARGKDGAK